MDKDFPISMFPAADAATGAHGTAAARAAEGAVQLSETDLAEIISAFMKDDDTPEGRMFLKSLDASADDESGYISGSGSVTGAATEEIIAQFAPSNDDTATTSSSAVTRRHVDEVVELREEIEILAVDGELDDASDESYSTSIIDFEEDPYQPLREHIAVIFNFARSMDLRSDRTYARSISGAHGSWTRIGLITVKDQLLSPWVQGFGMRFLKLALVPWFGGASRSGKAVGGSMRKFVKSLFGPLFYILSPNPRRL
ncbi:uncharacterized protein V1518DRAFT_415745 [Limtongia smithiae]|uniref:uncharacterized protein n=1 Tax=Limtongia smithiae TaxID=1125753 RepID=UPI0034CD9A69